MEAPDKIYIAESLIKAPYGNEWSPTPYVSRENTEYIRKDALLEWIKEELKRIEHSNRPSHIGTMVLEKVIDKINSM